MFQRDLWKKELHRVPRVVGAEDMWVVCLNKVGKEAAEKLCITFCSMEILFICSKEIVVFWLIIRKLLGKKCSLVPQNNPHL